MTVTPAYFLSLSLHYLRAMIGDSQVWRAIVAQPDTDWDTLATLIAAATSPQAAALAKIVKGCGEDDSDHDDYVALPRCIVRRLEPTEMMEFALSTYGVEGVLLANFEIPTPATYLDSYADQEVDFANKIGGIIEDLKGLQKSAGYLDIKEISVGQYGQGNPKEENGVPFWGCELLVTFRGA